MKRISNIFIILIFLTLSGCWTKVYLGKEKEPDMTFSDDMAMSSRAIDPTTVPAGGTWGTVRGILNTNFGNINGTLDSIEVITTKHDADIDTLELQTLEFIDSLAAHRTELDGKLNLSDSLTVYVTPKQLSDSLDGFTGGGESIDTTSLSARIDLKAPIDNPTLTGTTTGTFSGNLTGNVTGNVSGSAGTIINSTTSTGGNVALVSASSPTSIHYSPDLQYTELLGALSSTNFLAGSITSGSYYGANSILSLSSGSNVDFTITPKGTGVIKKSTTDTIATQAYARQFGGSGTVTMSDVQGEIADSLINYVAVKDSTGISEGSYISGYTFQTGMSNKVHVSDSTGNAPGNYVTRKALVDSLAAFEGGGGVTLEAVQNVISDSLDARIGGGVPIADIAVMQVDSLSKYVTPTQLSDSITANLGGAVGLTLNGGSITLTGDLATADDVTFYTNGDGQYDLPAGGGNLTIMSQVQGWISDSIAANLGGGGGADSSIYVTVTRLTDSLDVMRVLINDLIAVVENLGVDVSAPSIDSMEIGNFADDTLVIYFSEKLNTDSIPASSVFYLTEGVNEMGIASISFPSDTVMYAVLDSTAVYGSTYLLDYTRAHPYLQDSTGNAIATFSNRSVINNMPEPAATGLLEGLIAYWDMQESSGNIVDEVASLAGVPASTAPDYSQTGRIGNAINFNYMPTYGGGTRFDVGDDLLQSNQVSISAWIYPTDSDDSFTIISNNASGYGYRFFCGGGGGGVAADVSDGSGHTASPDAGTLTINTWHHVVLVVNGTNVTTYINGTQSDQEAFAYNIGYGSGSSVTIGANYDNNNSFGGRIDELGIWNRALTTDEIAALYNTGSGLAYSSFGN